MAVSGVNNYRDVLFHWQGQQLKSNENASSSYSGSSAVNSLFNSSTSMVSQVASMVELTKYAMDAMGVSSDSRVTFNQIIKYREKLTSEFNQAVKAGLEQSGISDISGLSFSLDKDGKISVIGANAQDRKAAQAWLDSNPTFGQDLRKSLTAAGIEEGQEVQFTIASTGRITLVDTVTQNIQAALDKDADLTADLRKGLEELGVSMDAPIEFSIDENGLVTVKGDHPDAEKINEWLAKNPALGEAVKKQLDANKADASATTLRLGKEGNIQVSVNSAVNNDIQDVFNKADDLGKGIRAGLSSLGIDPKINFSIQIGADGAIKIISDHPDRDKVQRFFDENPELIKKYQQIETLAGIDDARKAMQVNPTEMRRRIQIESMSAWWAGSGNANSYFGNYGSDGFSLLAGLNMNV